MTYAEALEVCRNGGKVAHEQWKRQGFWGYMFEGPSGDALIKIAGEDGFFEIDDPMIEMSKNWYRVDVK